MGQSGWKNLDEVWIPPIETEGFQEEVVIRKRIEPAPAVVEGAEAEPESAIVPEIANAPEVTKAPEAVPEITSAPEIAKAPEAVPEIANAPEAVPEITEEPEVQSAWKQTVEGGSESCVLSEEDTYDGEDATVLLSDSDEYDGEEATVLLAQEIVFTAYVERKSTGEKVCIDKDCFVIGKSSSADYVIKDDKTISRKHAAINKTADGYYLEDLGSSNHTFVDGTQITEPVKLINNTVFQLSNEEFEFTLV